MTSIYLYLELYKWLCLLFQRITAFQRFTELASPHFVDPFQEKKASKGRFRSLSQPV